LAVAVAEDSILVAAVALEDSEKSHLLQPLLVKWSTSVWVLVVMAIWLPVERVTEQPALTLRLHLPQAR
jgi:hypothetical protein